MATGTDTIDFGADPTSEASVTVTTAGLSATDHIEAFAMRDSTTDNDADAHDGLAAFGKFVCEYVDATHFLVKCFLIAGEATGQFKFRWATAA